MTINSQMRFWGFDRNNTKRWLLLAGGLLVVAGAFYLVRPVAETLSNGEVTTPEPVHDFLWQTALFFGPLLVSAAYAYTGGGLIDSLAIGVVPSVGFTGAIPIARALGTGGSGDIALWLLLLMFAAIGVAGAFIGFVIGTAGRLITGKLTALPV